MDGLYANTTLTKIMNTIPTSFLLSVGFYRKMMCCSF